jgi:two-component system sensor histidine kinase PhoQ
LRREPLSLRARLLLVSACILLGFVVLTAAALDRAFRASADTAQGLRLEALLYLLMGTLESGSEGAPAMPQQLPEARLSVPGSGLYAAVTRNDRPQQWRSESTLGLDIPFDRRIEPGGQRSEIRTGADGTPYRVVSQGVRWAIGSSPSLLTFSVAAPLAAQGAEIDAYRRSLWGALAVMAVLLLLALVVVQRWGLRPLRRLARQLARMEAGEIREVPGAHPAELAPLVANLNRLLVRERTQLERYRAALGDLAHSLKTPLAVLRGAPADAHLPTVVAEQISRMDQIVNYQLQRAATAGASQSGAPLPVATLVERLFATMAKVYAARALQLDHDIDAGLAVRLDEGDAMELLGNLVDNACKWATHRVRVHAERRGGGLWLVVDDDGPGIDEPERLLRRGQRGDERMPGHGIGLAIAQDIALAYRGELRIEHNEAGGARVVAWLGQA